MTKRQHQLRWLTVLALGATLAAACSSGGGGAFYVPDAGQHDAGRRDGGNVDAGRDAAPVSRDASLDGNAREAAAGTDASVACSTPGPVVAGPLTPASVSSNNQVGNRAWTAAPNARQSDNLYASVSAMTGSDETQYLLASNFGFTVPSNAVVTGVVVEIEKRTTFASTVTDNYVRLVTGGVVSLQDHATGPAWFATDTLASYGDDADLWGVSLSPADVNASGFGAAFSARYAASSGNDTVFVDQVRMTVHYTCP